MTIDRSMAARTEYEEFEEREREHGAGRRGEHAGEISVDAELVHGLEYQHAEQVHDDIAADVAHERTAITPSEHHRARGLVAEQDPAHDRHARCDRVASAQKDAKRVDAITKRGVDSPRDHEAHRLSQHFLKHNSRAVRQMKRTVATTLVLALPLSALLWLSGAVPLHLALGGVTLVVFFVTFSGFLALRALRLAELPASAAWVAGVFASALVVYVLVAWFKLLAVHAFALWAGALAACAVFFPERDPRAQPLDREDLAGLAVCGLVTLMWCRAIAQASAGLVREGVLYAWIDYFVHGGIISQFGDPLATRGS